MLFLGGNGRSASALKSEKPAFFLGKTSVFKLVGERGFEPLTFWSRTKRATRLRYSPNAWTVPGVGSARCGNRGRDYLIREGWSSGSSTPWLRRRYPLFYAPMTPTLARPPRLRLGDYYLLEGLNSASASLFYSMDIGVNKGENGGSHEAILGGGLFLGPLVGVFGARWLPALAGMPDWRGALGAKLAILGFYGLVAGCGLLALARRRRPATAPA